MWHACGAQWQQVATSGNKWRLVAVRSHFGLRLDGRNNPARASNRPGRRLFYRDGECTAHTHTHTPLFPSSPRSLPAVIYNTHPTVAKNAIHYYVINAFTFILIFIIFNFRFSFDLTLVLRSAPLSIHPSRGSNVRSVIV